MTLRFSKHHSAGNDFLVVLVSEPLPGSTTDPALALLGDPATAAAALCHRRRGVGADGLVLGVESAVPGPMSPGRRVEGGGLTGVPSAQAGPGPMPAGRGVEGVRDSVVPDAQAAPVRMKLWNSDGSEAEISGNGLRCLAQALARSRGVDEIDVKIDTAAGPRRCRIGPGADSRTAIGRVEMGPVTLDPAVPDQFRHDPAADQHLLARVPDPDRLAAALAQVGGFTGRWRTGSVGNPHAVVEVADPDAVVLEEAGPAVEACFAGGANVHFAASAGPRRVQMRIWERGAGATESCGSGSTVAAAVFDDWGTWPDSDDVGAVSAAAGVGEEAGNGVDEIIVAMPGGESRVHLGPPATLTGPVIHVADIEIDDWGNP